MIDLEKCKHCNRELERRFIFIRPSGHKIFHDSTGRQWHGLTCPDCRTNYFRGRRYGNLTRGVKWSYKRDFALADADLVFL
jgi:uncharacterized protein with PIN domain